MFNATFTKVTSEGWKSIYADDDEVDSDLASDDLDEDEREGKLPDANKGEVAEKSGLQTKETKPPKLFTETTLNNRLEKSASTYLSNFCS